MVCCKMRAKVHIIIIKCNYFVRKLSIFNIKTIKARRKSIVCKLFSCFFQPFCMIKFY